MTSLAGPPPNVSTDDVRDLFDAAVAAKVRADAPYSTFSVGCALRTAGGLVVSGCNDENAACPQGSCAEAGAISAMVVAGELRLVAVLVVTDGDGLNACCCGCRQRLREFAALDTEIHVRTGGRTRDVHAGAPAGAVIRSGAPARALSENQLWLGDVGCRRNHRRFLEEEPTMKHHRIALAAAALAAACSLAACGSDTPAAATTAPAAATTAPATAGAAGLTIKDFTFSPTTVTAGVAFTLKNEDGFAHTVTAKDGTFSVQVESGATESLTIDAPGTYDIICKIHASMKGTIVVQ